MYCNTQDIIQEIRIYCAKYDRGWLPTSVFNLDD